jgi:FtsP/CotA-like multicopper oxidase with cupredoxin domain
MTTRLRLLVACLATGALVVPLFFLWFTSLVPGTYSVMDMGYVDDGGSSAMEMSTPDAAAVSVADLVADEDGLPDVSIDLVAAKGAVTLASGRVVRGYTLNGTSPGPLIEAQQGDLVEVTLHNESVPGGVTLHWHGVDVPNGADGVAGVTQDAVGIGEAYTYRFVAEDAGTYWYHSHQVSHEQVQRGLLGPILIHPSEPEAGVADVVALTHTYAGTRTINGLEGDVPVEAAPGQRVRVRLINTDNGPVRAWTTGPFTLRAVDGSDLNEPTPVEGVRVTVTAGGRNDLEVTVPDDGSAVRVVVGGSTSLVVGPTGSSAPEASRPAEDLDVLSYGSPADLGFDPAEPDRRFDYDIGRRPGFLDGRPGLWWTINGHQFPDVPMFAVAEGDVVVMTITNGSGTVHPMHLHGHHAVVLSRNGVASTGSPWWVDSLDVEDGDSYEIAFVADNPGVWMDHCHNLPHAVQGLVAHLMYEGVTTPFLVGGDDANSPE